MSQRMMVVSSEPPATYLLSFETASEDTDPVCPFAAGSHMMDCLCSIRRAALSLSFHPLRCQITGLTGQWVLVAMEVPPEIRLAVT